MNAGGIIAATPAHAAALGAIHRAAFGAAGWSDQVLALQLDLPGMAGLIAPAGGMVLARAAADQAEIVTLAVLPEARRQGLGRTLLEAAMAAMAARGAATMFLEVEADNLAARALYAAAGFERLGQRKAYYGPGRDALILGRPISIYAAGA